MVDYAEDSLVSRALKIFHDKFAYDPEVGAFAPGRVNLIGEHVDYNGGFVMPFALPYKTIIVGSRTTSGQCNIFSGAGDTLAPASFVINDKLAKGEPEWANYVKGTVYYYLSDLPPNLSFDAVIISNVPMGSGLSSSAALE